MLFLQIYDFVKKGIKSHIRKESNSINLQILSNIHSGLLCMIKSGRTHCIKSIVLILDMSLCY